MRSAIFCLGFLAGCSIPGVDMPFDGDQDGLLSDEEEALGTDPSNPDSDDDGFADGDEVANFTDPLNPAEHPYTGGWPMDACRADMDSAGTGTAVGDVAPTFALTDQYGEEVRLHDFCGQAVIVESSAIWCPSCQAAAPELAAMYEAYKDRGLMVITLLGENNDGGAPTTDELMTWAETYGSTHPVVADPGWAYSSNFISGSIPSETVVSPGVIIEMIDQYGLTAGDIEAYLPQ